MILGMITSPLMMKGIKILKQRRRVDRILREISEQQQQSKWADSCEIWRFNIKFIHWRQRI